MIIPSIPFRLDTFPGFDRSPGHGTTKGQVPGYWVPGRVQFLGPKFPRIIATILEKKRWFNKHDFVLFKWGKLQSS